MTGNVMNFRGPIGQFQPKLFRPDRMADAVAEWVERQAPHGRRAYLKRRFKALSEDDARRVAEGRASKAQLDMMFREGGWPFVLEVFGLFFDQQFDQYLAQERKRHEANIERLGALAGDFRTLAASARGDGDRMRVRRSDEPRNLPRRLGADETT